MTTETIQPNRIPCANVHPVILIVDDKPENLAQLAQIFSADYDVLLADDDVTAFDNLHANNVDVVLLDIMLRGRGGLNILQAIRDEPQWAGVVVILISMPADDDLVVAGLNLGANDFIVEPINHTLARARVDAQVGFKHLLEERQNTIERLQNTRKEQIRLMQMATHDLRHPITNIRMAEAMLRDYLIQHPEAEYLLNILLSTVNSMQEILEDFMNAFTMNERHYHFDRVRVQQVMDALYIQYQLAAEEKSITIEMGDMPGVVYTDAQRLEQSLANLLSNAIKYSPFQSTIRLWSRIIDEQVFIAVADEGPGIPVEERDLLFTEFGKLSTRPTGDEPSVGLGLWIVKQTIEAMRGEVGADFPEAGGSVFWVSLPRT